VNHGTNIPRDAIRYVHVRRVNRDGRPDPARSIRIPEDDFDLWERDPVAYQYADDAA
jgi:hypothetical protein